MTVAELIAKLQALPQNLPVVTRGFDEDGYDLIETVNLVTLRKIVDPGSHSGGYDEDTGKDPGRWGPHFTGDTFDAVYIDR